MRPAECRLAVHFTKLGYTAAVKEENKMKKRILALLTAAAMVLTMVPAMAFAESAEPVPVVAITKENFPDDNFRDIVVDYDEYDDEILYDYEIKYIRYMDLTDEGISDLTGIQYFSALEQLYCNGNQLTSLDVSYMKNLVELNCSNNLLTELNVWGCSNLHYLYAHHNRLETLDLDPDARYETLQLQYNDFTDESDIKKNGNALKYTIDYAYHPQNSVQPVRVNESNFPDPAFRKVLAGYAGSDGMLSPDEFVWIRSLDLSNSDLEDLTGIHHFFNLEELYVNACYLTEIPELPDSIKKLQANYNYLTELPELPESLEFLMCIDNQLTSLPELPEGLKELHCYDNQLMSLPELPYGLETLACTRNQLTSLPNLPDTLDELSCSENKLTQLPKLPAALVNLQCDRNRLTSLPTLPASLKYMNCEQNQITELPALPSKILNICISVNKMGGILDLTQAPFLEIVEAGDNLFTGVKLNPTTKYERIDVSKNAMKSTADITGRNDIVWDISPFWFSDQKEACDLNGHSYKAKVTKASFDESGSSVNVCTVCGEYDYSTQTMIAGVKAPGSITKVYSGSVFAAPKFAVKTADGKTLKQGTDYTVKKVTSAKLKNVGKYEYKITLKGAKYKGSKSVYVTVNPKGTVINKVTKPAKKQIKVTWQKRTAQVTGYQIRYSTKQNMNGAVTVKVKNFKTNTKTIKNLKSKKKYWVQVRTYKTVNGKMYVSKWSTKKTVTTK